MAEYLAIASQLPQLLFEKKCDDDLTDRLNYRYTVAILLVFCVIVISRQSGSEGNINCWVPAHFTSNYEQYVSKICYVTNTYYVDKKSAIPKLENEKKQNEIKYYQWVVFILLLQALFFYIPRIIWRTLVGRSGIDLEGIIDAANNYKSIENYISMQDGKTSNLPNEFMDYLVVNINQYVDDKRRYDENRTQIRLKKVLSYLVPCAGRFMGNYLLITYLLIKIVYFLNTILQVFVLGILLNKNFFLFGIDFIMNIVLGGVWSIESEYFPKKALCDFNIREIGNPNISHRYTIECVLPINLFNQQIFMFLWFWYFLLLVWNISGFFIWLSRSLPLKSSKWITNRVSLNVNLSKSLSIHEYDYKKRILDHFINVYLEPDGFFLIRIISINTNDFVATDLIHQLWIKHLSIYENKFYS